jgi:hypothetical protein
VKQKQEASDPRDRQARYSDQVVSEVIIAAISAVNEWWLARIQHQQETDSIDFETFEDPEHGIKNPLAELLSVYIVGDHIPPPLDDAQTRWLLRLQSVADGIALSRRIQFVSGLLEFGLTMLFYVDASDLLPQDAPSVIVVIALVVLTVVSGANALNLVVLYGRYVGVVDADWAKAGRLIGSVVGLIRMLLVAPWASAIESWFVRREEARRSQVAPVGNPFFDEPRTWFLFKSMFCGQLTRAELTRHVAEATGKQSELVESAIQDWCKDRLSESADVRACDFFPQNEDDREGQAEGLWHHLVSRFCK